MTTDELFLIAEIEKSEEIPILVGRGLIMKPFYKPSEELIKLYIGEKENDDDDDAYRCRSKDSAMLIVMLGENSNCCARCGRGYTTLDVSCCDEDDLMDIRNSDLSINELREKYDEEFIDFIFSSVSENNDTNRFHFVRKILCYHFYCIECVEDIYIFNRNNKKNYTCAHCERSVRVRGCDLWRKEKSVINSSNNRKRKALEMAVLKLKLQKEITISIVDGGCGSCLSKPASVEFPNCNHKYFCEDCHKTFIEKAIRDCCPLCRK